MFGFLFNGYRKSARKPVKWMLWGFFYYSLLMFGLLLGIAFALVLIVGFIDVIEHSTPTETEWDIR